MPKLLLKKTKELLKKRSIPKKLLNIKKLEIKRNMKPNVKHKELERKRREKSKDSVNSKRRPPIDKLKSMPSELREHSRKVKGKPEKEKDLNNKRERESKLI